MVKVIKNLKPAKLVIGHGKYTLGPYKSYPLAAGDETSLGVVEAVMRGWAVVEDTDVMPEPIAQSNNRPTVKWEEETVTDNSPLAGETVEDMKPLKSLAEEIPAETTTEDRANVIVDSLVKSEASPPKKRATKTV